MHSLFTPDELTRFRDMFCDIVARARSGNEYPPIMEQIRDRVQNEILGSFNILFSRKDIKTYTELWNKTVSFAINLLDATADMLDREPEYPSTEALEKLEMDFDTAISRLPYEAPKDEATTSSTSGVITISEGSGVDGGFRRRYVEVLRADVENSPSIPTSSVSGRDEKSLPRDNGIDQD